MTAFVSQRTLALLGGGRRACLTRTGDPVRWLERRLRLAVAPMEPGFCKMFRGLAVASFARGAREFLRDAKGRLDARPERISAAGRPRGDSPQALAVLLKVDADPGDSLFLVLTRWVARKVVEREPTVKGHGRETRWKLGRLLDAVLPRWLGDRRGVETPLGRWERVERERVERVAFRRKRRALERELIREGLPIPWVTYEEGCDAAFDDEGNEWWPPDWVDPDFG